MDREGRGGPTDLVDLGESLDIGSVQHSQRQADHLQILATRRGRDVPGFGSHVEDDGSLQPGDEEVSALVDDVLLDTDESIEDDGAGATLDVVDGLAGQETTGCERDRHAVHPVEGPGGGCHLVEDASRGWRSGM